MSDLLKPKQKFTFFGQVYGGRAFLVILVSTVIAGFSDPNFGWNPNSARLLVSMWFVYLFVNYGGALVRVINGVRKSKGIRPRIAARPVYLLFLLFSLVLARVTGIEPALIFGTVLALEYTADTSALLTKYSGRATLAGALHNMLVGIVSWILYSVIATLLPALELALAASGSNGQLNVVEYLAVAVGEFLGMLTVASLAALPLSLLPFSFLEGIHLWRWSKVAWVITYVLGAFVYTVVLVSLPSSWSSISVPFALWGTFYCIYFIGAIGFWAYLRFSKSGPAETRSVAE